MEKPTSSANLFKSDILLITRLNDVRLMTNDLPLITLIDPAIRLRFILELIPRRPFSNCFIIDRSNLSEFSAPTKRSSLPVMPTSTCPSASKNPRRNSRGKANASSNTFLIGCLKSSTSCLLEYLTTYIGSLSTLKRLTRILFGPARSNSVAIFALNVWAKSRSVTSSLTIQFFVRVQPSPMFAPMT